LTSEPSTALLAIGLSVLYLDSALVSNHSARCSPHLLRSLVQRDLATNVLGRGLRGREMAHLSAVVTLELRLLLAGFVGVLAIVAT
jgi:hypothetical protein